MALFMCSVIAFGRGRPETPTDIESLTRSDAGGGGVTVEAVYMTARYLGEIAKAELAKGPDGGTYLVFRLTLDTHAGDLMEYDPSGLATLRTSQEGSLAPLDWQDDQTGSHHRTGYLRFAGAIRAEQGTVELILRDLAGVPERVFRWDLPTE